MGSAEEYTLETNEWRPLPNMLVARGRHATAQLDGKVYAIGGSDGHTELMSVEYYDPVKKSWKQVANLLEGRSSPGIFVCWCLCVCVWCVYACVCVCVVKEEANERGRGEIIFDLKS